MGIRIRPAEASDLPALGAFALALAHAHVAIDHRRFVEPDGGVEAFLHFFSGELARPESVLLIADHDGTAAGYAFLRMEPGSLEALCAPSAWLHDVYVDPPFRGRGVARSLVSAAIHSARELGSRSLMLGVSPANRQAREFYLRLGLRDTMIEMRIDLE
jgi:GNAT superfamily N-acetyltransferase